MPFTANSVYGSSIQAASDSLDRSPNTCGASRATLLSERTRRNLCPAAPACYTALLNSLHYVHCKGPRVRKQFVFRTVDLTHTGNMIV
eukprot:3059834-Amphidinium_carterae.1